MEKQDYYALINYRGTQKNYYVSAHEENDVRVEYLDYNPEREWSGVWIKDGIDKIVKKFDSTTEEYKYFKSVFKRFMQIREEESIKRNCPVLGLGTSYTLKFYKQAIKETPNPLNLQIYKSRIKLQDHA